MKMSFFPLNFFFAVIELPCHLHLPLGREYNGLILNRTWCYNNSFELSESGRITLIL